MKIKNKQVFRMDLIVIGVTLVGLLFIIGYAKPLVLSPKNDLVSENNSVLFSFDKAEYILIDDNLEFSSPERIYASNNLVINLKPGVYYWKIVGVLQSDVRKFTINSRVELKFRENFDNNEYEVVNSGNMRLLVDIFNSTNLVGNTVLEIDESKNVSGTKFLGREYEN
jgi:hypothetical protein